jgi:hypothetical protein
MRRRANPRLKATPSAIITARVPLAVAQQLQRLVRRRDCSVPQLIADSLNAIEAQATSESEDRRLNECRPV